MDGVNRCTKAQTELTAALKEFEADHVWISENLERLLSDYEDRWVAVERGQVIDSDPDFMVLRSRLTKPAWTCVEFITRRPLPIIL